MMENKTAKPIRFLCFGVGAIGTYIGGSLALSGQPVVFLDRPEVAENFRSRGLKLRINGQERIVPEPKVVSGLAEVAANGPYDAALLAVKAFDTDGLLNSMAPIADQLPPVLCLQNGVENEARVGRILGKDRVVTGTITSAVGRRGSGDIVLEKLRGVGIALDHPLAPSLIDSFNVAGLKARGYSDPASLKWSKMITNLLANASSAILDMAPLAIFSDPALYRLEIDMIKEALRVMAAQGIGVSDLPGTPVRLLVWMIRSLPLALSQPLLVQSLGKGRGAKMPSFHIDLYSGRGKSEVDYLNGAVVRFGQKFGIATPVNHWLNQTLQKIVNGEISLQSYAHHPEKYITELSMQH
jgi:2-dehydropantoate 2-reductase